MARLMSFLTMPVQLCILIGILYVFTSFNFFLNPSKMQNGILIPSFSMFIT